MGAVFKPVSGVLFFEVKSILIVERLEELVVNENPIVLRADVWAQQACNYLTMIDRRPAFTEVMQQGNHNRLFITPISVCSRCCLYAVLVQVHSCADVDPLLISKHFQYALSILGRGRHVVKPAHHWRKVFLSGFFKVSEGSTVIALAFLSFTNHTNHGSTAARGKQSWGLGLEPAAMHGLKAASKHQAYGSVYPRRIMCRLLAVSK